jgi:hypothetical protein
MAHPAAAAVGTASAGPLALAGPVPPRVAGAPTPSEPNRANPEWSRQPLVIAAAWWLLFAVAVIRELAG